MAKVLVTGGAGFIGSHVTQQLLSRGDEVVIIDDFSPRYNPALKETRLKNMFADSAKPKLVRGDICDRELLADLFSTEQFDTVIHLAAWASVQNSIKDPYIYTSVNLDGTVNVLEESRKHNIKNLVFASSSSVYGGRTTTPFKETDDISQPISPYAATKAAGELLCATWHQMYKLPITCLRFFTVYGPWGRPDMALFLFADAIREGQPVLMRGKETARDFTYIDDIVDGIIAAHDNPHDYLVANLGRGERIPLPRFIAALEEALGAQAHIKEVPLPTGDVPVTLADISRAGKELNYTPRISVEEGVKKFADWYREWYVPNFLQAPAAEHQPE